MKSESELEKGETGYEDFPRGNEADKKGQINSFIVVYFKGKGKFLAKITRRQELKVGIRLFWRPVSLKEYIESRAGVAF